MLAEPTCAHVSVSTNSIDSSRDMLPIIAIECGPAMPCAHGMGCADGECRWGPGPDGKPADACDHGTDGAVLAGVNMTGAQLGSGGRGGQSVAVTGNGSARAVARARSMRLITDAGKPPICFSRSCLKMV